MPDETKTPRPYNAPALERGFDILQLLASGSPSLTISEIAQGLGRSMSEVFRIIIVMERQGWLNKDPGTDRYSVSYRLLDLAYRATPAQALATVAAPVMAELSGDCNQSCHLVIRAEARGLVIQRQENSGPAGFAMRAGVAIDIVTSCSGHVLLAYLSDAELRAVKERLSDAGAAVDKIAERLALVRQRGFEMLPSARAAGVTDLSAPIFGFDGRVAAALTVPYLVMIDGSQTVDLDQARELLMKATTSISDRLGAPRG